MVHPAKDDRLYLRVSVDDKALIEEAASARGESVSQFIVRESVEAAEGVLAEQTGIVLGEADWRWFAERLDEAPRDNSKLRALLDSPDVFDE